MSGFTTEKDFEKLVEKLHLEFKHTGLDKKQIRHLVHTSLMGKETREYDFEMSEFGERQKVKESVARSRIEFILSNRKRFNMGINSFERMPKKKKRKRPIP